MKDENVKPSRPQTILEAWEEYKRLVYPGGFDEPTEQEKQVYQAFIAGALSYSNLSIGFSMDDDAARAVSNIDKLMAEARALVKNRMDLCKSRN